MPADKTLSPALSKSRFIAGVQCLKRLNLQIHHPELAEMPDESTLAMLQQGQEVGDVVSRLGEQGQAVGADAGHHQENDVGQRDQKGNAQHPRRALLGAMGVRVHAASLISGRFGFNQQGQSRG